MNSYTKYIIIVCIIIFLFIYQNYESLKIKLLNLFIVKRGILAPNCPWMKLSELFLKDSSGIELYNNMKHKYGDFPKTYQFNTNVYLVTNVNHIKTILDNSPNIFGAGTLKKDFFHSFMKHNVGISEGCPWKQRRQMNEHALNSGKIHQFSDYHDEKIQEYIHSHMNQQRLEYTDFSQMGKTLTSQIVFGVDKVPEEVYQLFSEANATEAIRNPNFRIDPKIYNIYHKTLNYHMNHPKSNSLIQLCIQYSKRKEEIFHQIPHFMFPITGLFTASIPRLLTLLFNHPRELKKLIHEIQITPKDKIYTMKYSRKCILEGLRLMNPVITTFRTLLRDFSFGNNYTFPKGTQFLILNNPVLREKEYFKQPNLFIPSRWNSKMEQSYYAISFNQGPQKCPGKELVITLIQSFLYHFFTIKQFKYYQSIVIDTKEIPQIINPCSLFFEFK